MMSNCIGTLRTKTVYLLGGDPGINKAVANRLVRQGVPVREFPDAEALMSAAKADGEITLLVDTRSVPDGDDVATFLGRLEDRLGHVPDLFCIAHSRDLDLRLQALRAGALAFFVAPVSPDELAGCLAETSGKGPFEPYRVLVVDDQPVAATFAARMLERAGMKTRSLAYPLLILEVMEEFRPDLVLMDMHMPEVSGVELTGIIREHDDFFRIPVVFLSRESHLDLQLDALRRGGDDFLTKPVDARRLVEVVQRRIQVSRSREGRRGQRRERDSKSGLYNRRSFLRCVDRALAEETVREPGNGLLVIDLDAPEALLERIGPGCRDALIQHLGHLIEECLAPTDTAGRIGEYSFGLLARRSRERELTELAERLREAFATQQAVGGGGATTASIGIGLFRPCADDALTMLSRAERAASRAQGEGGDRVALSTPLIASAGLGGITENLLALVEDSLRKGGLQLFYQPVVAMRKVPGHRYEASPRLCAPDGEYIPPFDFLPAAEEGGLMPEIDRWVMVNALDRLRDERDRHRRDLRFFIQQTMESAVSRDWIPSLRDQIATRDLISMRPVVQFRLAEVASRLDAAAERFSELDRLGIKVCLSHFRGDEAGRRLVERMSVPLVKLAKEVVEESDSDALSSLIEELHRLKASVIAPGIDNPQSIARLWGCGVDFIQGNFLQLPARELGFDFSETALE
jgi:diguanylate cyclase (GGDEF)-like protein